MSSTALKVVQNAAATAAASVKKPSRLPYVWLRPVRAVPQLVRITLVKSHLSAEKHIKETCFTLGLRKPSQSMLHKNVSAIRGMIFTVHRYVDVEELPPVPLDQCPSLTEEEAAQRKFFHDRKDAMYRAKNAQWEATMAAATPGSAGSPDLPKRERKEKKKKARPLSAAELAISTPLPKTAAQPKQESTVRPKKAKPAKDAAAEGKRAAKSDAAPTPDSGESKPATADARQ